MMKRLLFLLLIFCTFKMYSQVHRLVIQIDTVDFQNGGDDEVIFIANTSGYFNQKWENTYENLAGNHIVLNFEQTLQLQEDSPQIYIPIDNYGSRIVCVKQEWHLDDTIKISKITVFQRLTHSTINCKTEIYNPRKSEYKVLKHKVYSQEINPTSHIKKLNVLINNKQYILNFQSIQSDELTSMFHGYNRKKYRTKHGNYRRGVRKFYKNCSTINKILEAKVSL